MWGRVVANSFLLIIYAYFFGQHSLRKYLDKGVVIVKLEEESSSISPPGEFLRKETNPVGIHPNLRSHLNSSSASTKGSWMENG